MQVGDRLRIGAAEVVVTQPRIPCYKLGLRFGRDDIVKRFLASGRTGFYFRVITEGEVQVGDPIVLIERTAGSVAVSEITRLYARDKDDLKGLRRIADVATLPGDWRDYFKEQIDRVAARPQRRPAQTPSLAGFRTFTLREKVREGDNISSFRFVPEDGRPLPSYLPGQYLTVRVVHSGVSSGPSCVPIHCRTLPGPTTTASRSSGSRQRAEELRAAPGLVSTYFHDRLAVGDRIEAKAPASACPPST